MDYRPKTTRTLQRNVQPTVKSSKSLTPRVPVALQRQVMYPVKSFMTRPVMTQRQVVQPALQAASLQRQQDEQLKVQRAPLARQVTELSAHLPANAISGALQRQAAEDAAPPLQPPARPQTARDWVTVMRAHAENIGAKSGSTGLNSREHAQLTALQRQTAQVMAQGVKTSHLPAIQRHAEFAHHAVSLQRHPLTSSIPRAALNMVMAGERPMLQRAVDEALQADALQRQQDAQALQLHSLQRQLAELDEQAAQPVMQRIQERRGSGNPLPESVQRHLEQGLNHDLSGVRIHDDAEADKMAKGVSAIAFTTGKDIFFQSGKFNPNTQGGLELLAHEVTHTVQQSKGQVGKGIDPDGGLEQEAREMGKKLALKPVSHRAARGISRQRPLKGFTTSGSLRLQRQSDPGRPQHDDEDLSPMIQGTAGARGRESFVQAQMEATRQGGKFLAEHHRSYDYQSQFIRSGGGAERGLPDLLYGGNSVDGRYNGNFMLMYGSQDVAGNLKEISEYAKPGDGAMLKQLKATHPAEYERRLMEWRNRAEFQYRSSTPGAQPGTQGTVLATDNIDGRPVNNLREARIRRSALTAPSGGDGHNTWAKRMHRWLGENQYTHSQLLGEEINKARASAMLVPSAAGKGINQINLLPEHIGQKQLAGKVAQYWKEGQVHDVPVSTVKPVDGTPLRTFAGGPLGTPEPFMKRMLNKGQTQRSSGARYGAVGGGLVAALDNARQGKLDAQEVLGQTLLGAAASSRMVNSLAQAPGATLKQLAQKARAKGSVVSTKALNKLATINKSIKKNGVLKTASILKRLTRQKLGSLGKAGQTALNTTGLPSVLKLLKKNGPAKTGAVLARLGRKKLTPLLKNLPHLGKMVGQFPKQFSKTTAALKQAGLKGLYQNVRAGLPRNLQDFRKTFARGMGAGTANGLKRMIRGNAIIDAVISSGLSIKDNWKDLTKGKEAKRNQAIANVAVDTGVGVTSGLAGMATGAAIGSVIPVAGTAVGAVVGFAAGMLGSWAAHSALTKTGAAQWAKQKLGGGINKITNWAGGKNGVIRRSGKALATAGQQIGRKISSVKKTIGTKLASAGKGIKALGSALKKGSTTVMNVLKGKQKLSMKGLMSNASQGMAQVGKALLGQKGLSVVKNLLKQSKGAGKVAEKARTALGDIKSKVKSGLAQLMKGKGLAGLYG